MILRATTAAVLLAASVVALTGCLGSAPEPSPTPTAVFSSEEEAFAAAEETYRAYSAASNARRSDPTSSPDPLDFLISDALESALDARRQLEEAGVRAIGDTLIERIDPVAVDPARGEVEMDVCLNSANVRVVDEAGVDVTPSTRPDQALVRVSLVPVNDSLLIEASETESADRC